MLQELSPLKVRLFVPAEVAIVVPTFNERDNVRDIASRIASVLDGRLPWEIVFVDDDSCDGTTDLIHQLCREDPRIRLIRRLGRRGLSSAVVEGILSTSAPFLAVMDADLQHDERLLQDMLDQLRDAPWDLVVGSRYVKYGSVGEWE